MASQELPTVGSLFKALAPTVLGSPLEVIYCYGGMFTLLQLALSWKLEEPKAERFYFES